MRTILLLLPFLLLCGCSESTRYGDFASAESVDLVADATAVIATIHPPAKTRLRLVHDVEAGFGREFIESLRHDGFAVEEYSKAAKDGLALGFVLERLDDGKALRVSLFIGGDSISRLYTTSGEAEPVRYIPAGPWARLSRDGKEIPHA